MRGTGLKLAAQVPGDALSALAVANVTHTLQAAKGVFAVTLASDAPAFFLTVDAEGVRGGFDDNAITLLGGETRTLHFRSKAPVSAEAFARSLTIRHLQASAS